MNNEGLHRMTAPALHCPQCGQAAAGKFCSECGAEIQPTCAACGTRAMPGARFCHECGETLRSSNKSATAVSAGGSVRSKLSSETRAGLGIALVTVAVFAGLLLFGQDDRLDTTPGASAPTPSAGGPVDLSSMTPREAADRLFNRIMMANEQGDVSEALRFVPMALGAYQNLETLDNDARYHVGLIQVVGGDLEEARLQLAAIRQSAPDHLLGLMLEHSIAEKSGDSSLAAEVYKNFLAVYDVEIARERGEYGEHQTALDGFRARAEKNLP